LGNTASAASEKGYNNAKWLLFAALRCPNNRAAQILEACDGIVWGDKISRRTGQRSKWKPRLYRPWHSGSSRWARI